ncbi:DUF4232 domain-containing protein [Naasia lichenicola]|uniref:DUF4232 domain-containing protein n=1 Tax=Naasia lichenicola TaxID=2565933 RepID=A0A4S4FI75_9MICO|nr:DUF4232 domain-containing protein [Naasia lichenicola]THG30043.1 DUF4232 domain-containing protein [Naasia lichenicola]
MHRRPLAVSVLLLVAISALPLAACASAPGPVATGVVTSSSPGLGTAPSSASAASIAPPAACALETNATALVTQQAVVNVELTNSGDGDCVLQGNATTTALDAEGASTEYPILQTGGEQFSGDPVTVAPGGHAYIAVFLPEPAQFPDCAVADVASILFSVSGAPDPVSVDFADTQLCVETADSQALGFPVTAEPAELN